MSECTPQAGGFMIWTGSRRHERSHESHVGLLCPGSEDKANINIWGDGKGGGMVSSLNLNPVNPSRDMLIT